MVNKNRYLTLDISRNNRNVGNVWGGVVKDKKNAAPVVGKDGYYYFRYNVNAKYEIPTGENAAVYEIVDCAYENNVQTYSVRVECGDVVKYRDMTIDRLNYLFETSQDVKVLNEGMPCEFPLTKSEVMQYYARAIKVRNFRKREANAKLKDDKDYQKLIDEEKKLTPKWSQAIAIGAEDADELGERIKQINVEKLAIMDKLGVKPGDLKAPEPCETCNDKGITPRGAICTCAQAQSDKIKAYCSAERLVEKKIYEIQNS